MLVHIRLLLLSSHNTHFSVFYGVWTDSIIKFGLFVFVLNIFIKYYEICSSY